MYTNIPLNETTPIAYRSYLQKFFINKNGLTPLYFIATSQSHFLYDGSLYDQIDSVSMRSPLAPVLANLFMGRHEQIWPKEYGGSNVLFYRRYVE